eukprot:scaffold937_cov502-Prasinococcus_capsulatus_cf.AAC.3
MAAQQLDGERCKGNGRPGQSDVALEELYGCLHDGGITLQPVWNIVDIEDGFRHSHRVVNLHEHFRNGTPNLPAASQWVHIHSVSTVTWASQESFLNAPAQIQTFESQ